MHTPPSFLLFPLISIFPSQGFISTSSLQRKPPLSLRRCDIKCRRRLEGCSKRGFTSSVRQASVTVCTPVWCGGIHTWQINPCALSATHSIYVKSRTACKGRGDIFQRQIHCEEPLRSETTQTEEETVSCKK